MYALGMLLFYGIVRLGAKSREKPSFLYWCWLRGSFTKSDVFKWSIIIASLIFWPISLAALAERQDKTRVYRKAMKRVAV